MVFNSIHSVSDIRSVSGERVLSSVCVVDHAIAHRAVRNSGLCNLADVYAYPLFLSFLLSRLFLTAINSQFHAFFMFFFNGSPRSTTICLEAMLDVKPHNALRTPFPEAGKCILDSSLRYSCAKTRRRSETDLKYFSGFRFFFGGNFF